MRTSLVFLTCAACIACGSSNPGPGGTTTTTGGATTMTGGTLTTTGGVTTTTGGASTTTGGSTTGGSTCTAMNANATNSVTISGYAFEPNCIVVAPNSTVTWTNNDSVPHDVASEPGATPVFDLGQQTPGKAASYSFTNAGQTDVYCTIHPSMKMTVNVAD